MLGKSAILCTVAVIVATACGEESPTTATDPQLPPTTASALEAWLDAGHYRSWRCEPLPHGARSPSAHRINRICSNDLLSGHGAGEYPVGASSVKEIFDAAGTNITGYAVAVHVRAGTTGDSWYWYERVGSSVYADGEGSSGAAKSLCAGCHEGAGADAQRTGHDLVFTQVR